MALQPVRAKAPEVAFVEPGVGRVPMARYWRDGPAVFVFLRHFG